MHSFKRILKIVGVFLLAVVLLSVMFAEFYLQGENFDYQDARERDRLAGKVTVLICGASYTMYGIQPEILNQRLGISSYNVTGALMTMEGRYTLLKKELERNPVHTVVLEVSADTLIRDRTAEGPEGDLPILGRLSGVGERLSYLHSAFSLSEYPMAYYDLVSKGIESSLRFITGKYHRENSEMKLGYLRVKKDSRELPTNYQDIYGLRSLPEEIVPENEDGLERLVSLCKENGATVILVVTPKSKYYNCLYANLDYFDQWYRSFAEKHGVHYLNFNLDKEKTTRLPDSDSYYDETHMNIKGSAEFTKMLSSALQDIWKQRNYAYKYFDSYSALRWSDHYLDS